jgi:hypothetical protein
MGAAGTVANLETVCFDSPKPKWSEKTMNEQDQQPSANSERREAREHFWNTIVFPTARGLEQFFWNLAWFALLAFVVYCLFQK